jgi:CRISPR-associated protein (Cas_Cmr3)
VLFAVVQVALARAAGWDGSSDWTTMQGLSALGTGPFAQGGDVRIGPLALLRGQQANNGVLHWPAPSFIMVGKDQKGKRTFRASRPASAADATDLGALQVLDLRSGEEPCFGAWIDTAKFHSLLNNGRAEPGLVSEREIVHREDRIGIGRSNVDRVAANSMLYRAGHRRLGSDHHDRKSIRLCVTVDCPAGLLQAAGVLKEPVLVPFGGQGRVARLQLFAEKNADPSFAGKTTPAGYLISLLAPAFIEDASRPDAGLPGRLVALAGSRRVALAGWDGKQGHRVAMRWALPAGTTWYFETKDDPKVIDQLRILQQDGIGAADTRAVGYGAFAFGVWPEQ